MGLLNSKLRVTLSPSDHPYLNGGWRPNVDEVDTTDLKIIGEIPRDLNGTYIRNTENPVHDAIGRYHPFDGDGMLHAMTFDDGKARYRNRFIRTKGFLAEQEAGRALWAGIGADPKRSERPGWGAHGSIKDSSSTDVVVHAGEILTSFWQCGEPYRLDLDSLETLGVDRWAPLDGVSAHTKVDPHTGELLFFNYSKHAPYMHYGVVGADNKLKHYTPVPLPGPRLPHDMAFTKNYSILNDLPVYWRPELLEHGMHASHFYRDQPSRFAIIPRFGSASDVKWFEAAPTYVLHWLNAWEEGDEIVLDGYFQEEPIPEPLPNAPPKLARMMANLDFTQIRPHLHRWRFNLRTGVTKEEALDDTIMEFGMFNQDRATKPYRYVWSSTGEPGMFLFNGLVKTDLQKNENLFYAYGKGRFGSEAPYAPKSAPKSAATSKNSESNAEDDGYIITFITDLIEDRSECIILDAANIDRGPLCQILLPRRISSGTHAVWQGAT